jgi:hypothetical protein
MMSDQGEFSGDQCVVLPRNYLNSAEAVADIYEDELSAAADNLDVDELRGRRRFLAGTLLTPIIWALSGIFTVCM